MTAYRWRFNVRRNHGPIEVLVVQASSSAAAVDALPRDVTSWDFATWSDGTYRRLASREGETMRSY